MGNGRWEAIHENQENYGSLQTISTKVGESDDILYHFIYCIRLHYAVLHKIATIKSAAMIVSLQTIANTKPAACCAKNQLSSWETYPIRCSAAKRKWTEWIQSNAKWPDQGYRMHQTPRKGQF